MEVTVSFYRNPERFRDWPRVVILDCEICDVFAKKKLVYCLGHYHQFLLRPGRFLSRECKVGKAKSDRAATGRAGWGFGTWYG